MCLGSWNVKALRNIFFFFIGKKSTAFLKVDIYKTFLGRTGRSEWLLPSCQDAERFLSESDNQIRRCSSYKGALGGNGSSLVGLIFEDEACTLHFQRLINNCWLCSAISRTCLNVLGQQNANCVFLTEDTSTPFPLLWTHYQIRPCSLSQLSKSELLCKGLCTPSVFGRTPPITFFLHCFD